MHLNLDRGLETQRRRMHEKLWHMYECAVDRPREGGDLTEAFGELIMEEFEKVEAGGKRREFARRGERHQILANGLDLSDFIQGEVVNETALVHNAEVEIHGSLAGIDEWATAKKQSGFDRVMIQVSKYAIATGACSIRPVLHPGFPVGLDCVPPQNTIFFTSPTNTHVALACLEFLPGRQVLFTSVIDPENPRHERWPSVQALLKAERNRRGLYRQDAIEYQNGNDYPFRWQGAPIFPYSCYQDDTASPTVNPTRPDLYMGTMAIIIKNTRTEWHAHVSAANRLALLSDKPLEGLEQASTFYGTIINAHGENASQAKAVIQPEATGAALNMKAMTRESARAWLGRINRNIKLKETNGAQSGRAIELEMTNLWGWFQQQSNAYKIPDEHTIRVLISAWNYAVSHGYFDGSLIPEADDIAVEHKPSWTPAQKRQILADIKTAMDIGAATEVDYYLHLHGLSNAHRAEAEAAIIGLKREKARIAAGESAPATTDAVTWSAPREVAAEATEGFALYSRYNRPGTLAADRRGSPSAYRMAGKLKRAVALNYGDLMDIVTFAKIAQDTGADQPGWDDANDPSTQWIDFKCLGGAAGRDWANAELDKIDGVPGDNEDPAMSEESTQKAG